jgi:uncharacterized membrane protein
MTRVYWTIGFALVAIATGATVWLYGSLPEQIPTHWNIRGEVDGHGGKWSLQSPASSHSAISGALGRRGSSRRRWSAPA